MGKGQISEKQGQPDTRLAARQSDKGKSWGTTSSMSDTNTLFVTKFALQSILFLTYPEG